MQLTFDAVLFPWDSNPSFVFAALPTDDADAINDVIAHTGGFGSVKVKVFLGGSTWSTSLFPSKEMETYVLPLKKAIRKAEGVEVGDVAAITVEIVNI